METKKQTDKIMIINTIIGFILFLLIITARIVLIKNNNSLSDTFNGIFMVGCVFLVFYLLIVIELIIKKPRVETEYNTFYKKQYKTYSHMRKSDSYRQYINWINELKRECSLKNSYGNKRSFLYYMKNQQRYYKQYDDIMKTITFPTVILCISLYFGLLFSVIENNRLEFFYDTMLFVIIILMIILIIFFIQIHKTAHSNILFIEDYLDTVFDVSELPFSTQIKIDIKTI